MTLHPTHTGQPGRSETTRSTSQPTRNRQVDVAAIRRDYPIEDVVAAAGIELRPAGHGFVGRCPFHDDTTPSMSVAGVPDRFTCFGCGAHGDVIDFVQRLHGLTFIDAVHTLTADNPVPTPSGSTAPRQERLRPSSFRQRRGHWCHRRAGVRHQRARLAAPIRAGPRRVSPSTTCCTTAGSTYARCTRSCTRNGTLNCRATIQVSRLVGYAGHGWTTLVDALRRDGVTAHELTVMDLGQRTRDDRLIDTLRDRIIVPVLDADHRIRGFIGRDISGNPRAPKYRNPTHTPTFDKSQHPVPAHPPRPRTRRDRRHRRRRPRRPRHRRPRRSRRPQPADRAVRRQRRHRLHRPRSTKSSAWPAKPAASSPSTATRPAATAPGGGCSSSRSATAGSLTSPPCPQGEIPPTGYATTPTAWPPSNRPPPDLHGEALFPSFPAES